MFTYVVGSWLAVAVLLGLTAFAALRRRMWDRLNDHLLSRGVYGRTSDLLGLLKPRDKRRLVGLLLDPAQASKSWAFLPMQVATEQLEGRWALITFVTGSALVIAAVFSAVVTAGWYLY